MKEDAHLRPVGIHLADVVAIGVQHVWVYAAVLAAGVAVRFTYVSWGALTEVRTDGVIAELAADSRCAQTLVDVLTGLAVWHEPVAGMAGAVVAGGSVCAVLGALVDLGILTLVDT